VRAGMKKDLPEQKSLCVVRVITPCRVAGGLLFVFLSRFNLDIFPKVMLCYYPDYDKI